MPVRILHLEDVAADAELVRETLAAAGVDCEVAWVDGREGFVAALEAGAFDLIIADYGLPGFDGAAALALARERRPEVPFIVLSGTLGEEHAVEMLQRGATDYVLKQRLPRLAPAARRALREAEEQATRRRTERALEESRRFFERVADATPNVIYVLDLVQQSHVYVAGAARAVWGYTAEQVVAEGAGFLPAHLHPEDLGRLRRNLARFASAKDGEVVESLYRIRHAEGGWRSIHTRATVFTRAAGGEPLEIVGVAEDVSERKREEQHRSTQFAVTRVLAESASLDEARPRVLEALGRGLDFDVCEWWALDAHGTARLADVWHSDRLPEAELLAVSRGSALGPGSLPSRTWSAGNARWIRDLASEPDLARAPLPGLHAAFAVPLRAGDAARAVLLGFSRDVLDVDEDLLWMLDALSNPIGAFVERRLAESALRASQERIRQSEGVLRQVIDLVPHFIFAKDLEGRFILANKAVAEAYGTTVEELLGKRDADFARSEDEARRFRADDLAVLREGRPKLIPEETLTDARGVVHVLQTLKIPFAPLGPQVSAVLCIAIDITERRSAEERIRQQADLLDKASDAILARDLEGRVRYWNKGAERMYGWSGAEALDRNARELFEKDSSRVREAYARVREAGEWSGELEKTRKDGRLLRVESRWSLVRDEAGKPQSILTIDTDVTERKQLEAQFLRAQRMESIGTLAGGIAHDLNNVLSPILMAVEILRRGVADERGRRILNTIESSARRGADMVKQVLTFARGIKGERIVLSPRHVVKEMEKIARDTFPKTIQIRADVVGDLWNVSGDATQLHQVLLNLCVNARDAMPHGGVLTVKAENAILDAHYAALHLDARPGRHVVLSVTDSGPGIPDGLRERVFEPFFTTKEPGQGTGLGLSTSLAIVRSHGGFVNLYSEMGKGTTFKVYLPAAASTADAARAEPPPRPPLGRGELVLVVDDEAAIREITQETLEAHGYRVLTAAEGAEAVALFAQTAGQVDVVVTDMAMPLMDGQATIRALRRIDPRVRIIATSGLASSGPATPEEGTAQAFLLKPYTAERLLTTLRTVLGE